MGAMGPVEADGEFQLFVMAAAAALKHLTSGVDGVKVAEQQMEVPEVHSEFEMAVRQKWNSLGASQTPWDAAVFAGKSEVLTETGCSL